MATTDAVGAISISSTNPLLSKRIQSEVSKAVMTCTEHGVSTEEKNSFILREAMQAARAAAKASWPEEVDTTPAVLEVLEKYGKV